MNKYLYDATLYICPICQDSWYEEEDGHYRIDCKCRERTAWNLSKKKAEMQWNKILYRYYKLNDN